RYEIQSTITIATRPLLSSPPAGPHHIIPHYYVNNLQLGDSNICELHGWTAHTIRESVEREVWDAIILDAPTAVEIDLLEIRMNELDKVVDKFFIVESNRTINGTPKGLYFNQKRWESALLPFQHKIVYRAVHAPRIDSIRSPSPETWSARLRSEMNALLRTRSSNTRRPPIVLFSAPDEIPAAHTLQLLRDCAFPSPLHLQLRRFMYSFEWPVGWDSWRAQVHVWDTGTKLEELGRGEARLARRYTEYSREMVSSVALADAGWHCSYCYKNLDDIIAKMQGYGAEAASVTPENLQEAICEGRDMFNPLPEVRPSFSQSFFFY
ncbi:glycosyl transferase, partial [Fomitiporia mediterranea MF3/22]|uniref:glycosyl transferase n=1 Tax=Fomitiporia mediterranea (strain MF3/22) TaxID=694068 RepID=UPI00044089D9